MISVGVRMPTMAKKPAKAESGKKAARPGRPAGRTPTYTVFVRIPLPLGDAFEKMLAKTRRSATAELTIAMEEYLERAGLWPPPAN